MSKYSELLKEFNDLHVKYEKLKEENFILNRNLFVLADELKELKDEDFIEPVT